MELLKATPDKFYDLAIVDPPYGIGDTFISNSTGNKKGKLERIHKKIDWDNEIPSIEYFNELKRVSKKQVIWGANYFNCFDGGACVWYKNRGGNTLSQCEIASVSGQKKVDYVEIQILTGFVSNEIRIHPTQKPVKLYEWLLTNYAKTNDKILDTHLGSGSHAIACNKLGFELTACELDKDYYEASIKRIKQATAQERLFA
jgi:site-specific DNA-methyltransferase (adenine-specific)